MASGGDPPRPGIDQEAVSRVKHFLLDSDSSMDEMEEDLSGSNVPPIQSLQGAAAQEAIAEQAQGMDHYHQQEGAAAQHAQEAIAAQGMVQQQEEGAAAQEAIAAQGMNQQLVGQGNLGQFIQPQAINAAPHALQAQPAIAAQEPGSYYEIDGYVPQGAAAQEAIAAQAQGMDHYHQQEGAAAQYAQEAIAAQGMVQQQEEGAAAQEAIAAQGMNQQQLGLGNLGQFIQPHAINAAPHALQDQPAIAAQEPGSYYVIDGYVPPDLPPVPSIQHLIQECSQPFEKQLTSSDVDRRHTFRMNQCDAERHVLPMFNLNEDPTVGIELTMYHTAGDEYRVKFKSRMPPSGGTTHVLFGAGWKQFVRRYGLTEIQHFVTLWMFRNAETGNICLAVTWRRPLRAGPQNFRLRGRK